MKGHLISIGFGNVVASGKIVAIITPGSSPVRRLKDEARQKGKLVDATQGRRTRSLIVMDSDHVVLSAIGAETITQRLEKAMPTMTKKGRLQGGMDADITIFDPATVQERARRSPHPVAQAGEHRQPA